MAITTLRVQFYYLAVVACLCKVMSSHEMYKTVWTNTKFLFPRPVWSEVNTWTIKIDCRLLFQLWVHLSYGNREAGWLWFTMVTIITMWSSYSRYVNPLPQLLTAKMTMSYLISDFNSSFLITAHLSHAFWSCACAC